MPGQPITLRNNVGTSASSAASPASISPALTAASNAGNLLLLTVVVTGSAVSITTPAGWTLLQSTTITNTLAVALFALPNNAGGITSVAVTVTATGGGAAAAILEYQSVGVAPTVESGSAQNSTATAYGTLLAPSVPNFNELMFYVVGFAAATLTPNNSAEWSSAVGTAVSTLGVPNAQIACFWASSSNPLLQSKIGGSFSASVANGECITRENTVQSSPGAIDNIGGNIGIYVPTFYQGMIGG